jgi:hypothetical protein
MLDALRQLLKFTVVYRKYWLAPILIGLLILGVVLVAVQGSVLSPFLYAIF